MLVRRIFPLDAEYAFKVNLQTTNFGNIRGMDYPHQVEITVDGARVHLATIGGNADLAAMFEKPKEAGDAIEARLATRVRGESRAPDGRRGLRAKPASRRHAAARAVHPQLRGYARLDRTAPHSNADDHRSFCAHRTGRYAEPPADFFVPADQPRAPNWRAPRRFSAP